VLLPADGLVPVPGLVVVSLGDGVAVEWLGEGCCGEGCTGALVVCGAAGWAGWFGVPGAVLPLPLVC
jgi:hypothetical protein